MKKLLLLACLFALASCSITYNKKVDFDFQPQTNASLLHYLDSNNVAYNKADIATMKDTVTFRAFAVKNKLSIPDAFFFNKDGYRVDDNFKGTTCGHVIKNAEKINTAPAILTENINDWVKDFYFLENTDASGQKYDATVVLTWGLYANKDMPSINKTGFEWYKSLKEDYPNMKIRTILLNLDFQRSWFLTEATEKPASTGNISQ